MYLLDTKYYLLFFLFSQKGFAMKIQELSDISEAMAMAIQDVQIKYERYRDPPRPMEDIPEGYEGYLIPKGRNKYEWSAARPFRDMCLIVETKEMMNKFGDSQLQITKNSYNGKVAKYLKFFPENSTNQIKAKATITKSRRFLPLPTSTPEYYTILGLQREPHNITISRVFKEYPELLKIDNSIQKVGNFNTIRLDGFMDRFKDENGEQILLYRFYFSVDHGYTLIKFEHLGRGGKVYSCMEVTELEKVSEGLWYPKSGRSTYNWKDRPTDVFVYQASSIIVNSGLTPKYFDIEFPPGTKVADEITNIHYI